MLTVKPFNLATLKLCELEPEIILARLIFADFPFSVQMRLLNLRYSRALISQKKRQANSKVLAVARVGRRGEGLIRLTGAMVCMLSAPLVQLSRLVRYNAVVDFSCRSTAVRLPIKGH